MSTLFDEPRCAAAKGDVALPTPADTKSSWPFGGKDNNYIQIDTFMRNLYLGDDETGNEPWITHTGGRALEQWWMAERIGAEILKPEPGEPVCCKKNPAWEWGEIWRALNTYKVLVTREDWWDKPVARLIELLHGGPRADAMFPQSLKALLKDNEKKIIENGREWVGRPSPDSLVDYNLESISISEGVQAAYGTGLQFFQDGAIGPMTVEAAFILATQLAGINWYKLHERLTREKIEQGVFWISALSVSNNGEFSIEEHRKSPLEDRNQGLYYSLGSGSSSNNVEAGVVFALDIDLDLDAEKSGKNVFIFVIHAIDARSRFYVPDTTSLIGMSYTRYGPANPDDQPTRCTSSKGDGIRFYGHAHAAVMKYQVWMDWIGQVHGSGQPMPDYTQIGKQHFYLLTEDESHAWPRKHYLDHN